MKHSRLSVLGLISLAVFSQFAFAGANDPVELVESVPLETTLAVPGIRQTQEVWLEMIHGAQSTLDIEQFYISDQAGEALAPVLQAIQDAAHRGVKVRVLVDSKFFVTYPDSVRALGQFPGIQAKTVDFSATGGIQHAKVFVVDRAQSFVGSQNFDWRALSHIHEVGMRVNDAKIAADIEAIFERDWGVGLNVTPPALSLMERLFARLTNATESTPLPLYVAASPPSVTPSGIADSLTSNNALKNSAKTSIRIQVMEYTTKSYNADSTVAAPWRALDSVIRAAAARGVKVQLLVDVSDVKKAKADLTALAGLKNIEVRAATIPPWSGGAIDYARLIHSKYLIVDGNAGWVGSENWSSNYFTATRNIGLVLHDAGLAGQLNQIFDGVWSSGYVANVK